MIKNLPLKTLLASDHLGAAEPFLSEKLISSENFENILAVAGHFPGNLTGFLGFECRLGIKEPRADWAFAISGAGGDRMVLANLRKHGSLPVDLWETSEWKRIHEFSQIWADPSSILHHKIKCFWIEFDMPESLDGIPLPCVFFGPAKLPKGTSSNDIAEYTWLFNHALLTLYGSRVSKTIEHRVYDCIKNMPENTYIFQVGAMMSRKDCHGVRLYINRFKTEQIMPYLNSIGWNDETGKFATLVAELKDKADRFVLSFDILEDGIGPRIGIECSFTDNRYHKETRWQEFLNYLVDKGMCLPEKRDALLSYSGIENRNNFTGAVMKPLTSASQSLDHIFQSTFVRYINHVKIVYTPGHAPEAKAYPAVRLFKSPDEADNA